MLVNNYIFQIMALLALTIMNPKEPNAQTRLGEDEFGYSVTSGDFNADGDDDLTVGAPDEAPGNNPKPGAVFYLMALYRAD